MIIAILKSLLTGVVTQKSPVAPPLRFRGAPRIRSGQAFSSLPLPSICPSGAITRTQNNEQYQIDISRCIFCGRCALAGPGSAIELGLVAELSERKRDSLVVGVRRDVNGQTERLPAPVPAEAIAERIKNILGHSLHLRHLDSGSCNACDWELTALLNPVYDIRRLGIDFVASPRHADGVIVTGPVTRNLEIAVRRTYEAVPEPRLVIAVGACASSGGIAGRSYASLGGVENVLPVDVFIPGCPPRPDAIIFGILLAVGRLMKKR
jgi:Ni,Fe-hydrogenase III small subunit/formate hydrogenlyase subunit 6/NADH:ubiquinone oxidoreductase subunit I